MIRVSGLTKEYGNRLAVDNLSFSIEKGEIVAFLGPNGAGKTTTMRILSGFIPPTSGTAEIGGFDIMEQSIEARRLIGYLPETVPLYPDMTIYDFLKYMADLRKIRESEKRVSEVLELIHLADRANGYIANLSKGMRQRVGLAQSLLHRPEVLILDEPTIGLDPVQIIEVRNLIREIGKEHTVLLSTHILSEAQQICNRVLIINKGSIVTEDSTENLQSLVAGKQKVTMQVNGDEEQILAVLNAFTGIENIQKPDGNFYSFETAQADEVNPQIARAVIEKGFSLIDLHKVTVSLEDIFLQLTTEDDEKAATSTADN